MATPAQLMAEPLIERIHQLDKQIVELRTLLKAAEEAKRLQADEYERRLDILNHAHEEARSVLGTYIPREIYEKAMDAMLFRIGALEQWKEHSIGNLASADYIGRAAWAAIALTVGAGGALLAALYLK